MLYGFSVSAKYSLVILFHLYAPLVALMLPLFVITYISSVGVLLCTRVSTNAVIHKTNTILNTTIIMIDLLDILYNPFI